MNYFFIPSSFHIKNRYTTKAGINRQLQNLLFFHNLYHILNYSYLIRFCHYHYSLHTIRYFSSVSFSLKVNKFIILYFRSLLCFAWSLSESKFWFVYSFSFPVIHQQIYCSIQIFKLVNYSLMSHFRGPGSILKILGSHIPGLT